MKKKLKISKKVFESNKDNEKFNEAIASGKIEVGKSYDVPTENFGDCGGQPLPPPKIGEVGVWTCVNGVPVWDPA